MRSISASSSSASPASVEMPTSEPTLLRGNPFPRWLRRPVVWMSGVTITVLALVGVSAALRMGHPKTSSVLRASVPLAAGARTEKRTTDVARQKAGSPLLQTVAHHPESGLPRIRDAYKRGDYRMVEQAVATLQTVAAATPPATAVTDSAPTTTPNTTVSHTEVGQASYLAAFSAARQGDLTAARQRFAAIVADERKHPEDARPTDPLAAARAEQTRKPEPGQDGPPDTLEERAAYQKAVCAFGLKEPGAEAEFVAFMKTYPESPLVAACIKRIARLHGGDIPKEAEAVWKQAYAIQQARQAEREKMAALCGPATLAEVLRRRAGEPFQADAFRSQTEALARTMRTTGDRGTSITAMVSTAREKGFTKAEGVAVTPEGLGQLLKDKRTVIALLSDGGSSHFVLVEGLLPDGTVRFWDSNATGLLAPGQRTLNKAAWGQATGEGFAVAL